MADFTKPTNPPKEKAANPPKNFIRDKNDAVSVETSDVTSKPSDRDFRGAWVLNSDKNIVTEDLDLAKVIFKDKIRKSRQPFLEEEDVVFMKALENGDTDAQSASTKRKKSLRDAPAASTISDASNITQLKSSWDTELLGDYPD